MDNERFWSKVDRRGPDDCWPWKKGRTPKGYGETCAKGRNQRAHRVSFELTHGPIPERLLVLHRCDNPPCCNPSHLFVGTAVDNNRDMTAKGHRARGETVGSARLTETMVRVIRASHPNVSLSELARRYGVNRSCIHRVIHNKTWRHVE